MKNTPDKEQNGCDGEEGKPGQKPSEVLRISPDVSKGLMKQYQKGSFPLIHSQLIKY